jgi:hypothetical protein
MLAVVVLVVRESLVILLALKLCMRAVVVEVMFLDLFRDRAEPVVVELVTHLLLLLTTVLLIPVVVEVVVTLMELMVLVAAAS